ncbi:hypothetical protein BsWGS_13062 [Bradybaena similaris]
MQDLSERLKSFDGWPKQAHVRPEALAEAGLYYIGIEDTVTCFSCWQAFECWEPGDDPWREHAKWSPYCPYVKSVKGSEYVKQIHERVFEVNGNKEPASSAGQESSVGQESRMGQDSSVGRESNVGPERDRYTFAAAIPAMKSGQQEVETLPLQTSHGAKEPATEVEQEINSPPVKAILETYDIPIAEMRKLLERINIPGDDNFRSEDVKSVIENYDIPVETLRQMLQRVRIKKGSASPQSRTKDLERGAENIITSDAKGQGICHGNQIT